MEEQNGDHERSNSEEDVGDLLLGVGEVLGNPAIPKKNGKGNEDEGPRQRSLNDEYVLELDIPPGKETNLLPWNSFGCQIKFYVGQAWANEFEARGDQTRVTDLTPTGMATPLATNASLKRLACGENLLHLQGG